MSVTAPASTALTPAPFVNPFLETETTVRARLLAAMPDGMSQEPGTWSRDWVEIMVAETTTKWQAIGQLLAQAFPSWATGQQLDAWAAAYGLQRGIGTYAAGTVRFEAPAGTAVPPETGLQIPQSDPNAPQALYTTQNSSTMTTSSAGYVDVPIQANLVGSVYNAPAGSTWNLTTNLPAITGLTNLLPIVGGSDPQTDPDLRTDVLLQAQLPSGAGTVIDYQAWALEVPGVGFCYPYAQWDVASPVTGEDPGAFDGRQNGSVLLLLLDPLAAPADWSVVQAAQQYIAPARQMLAIFEEGEGVSIETAVSGDQTFPVDSFTVTSTTGCPSSGSFTADGVTGTVTYTGITSTTFVGCSGGTGTAPDAGAVYVTPAFDTVNKQMGAASLEVAFGDAGTALVDLLRGFDLSHFASGPAPSSVVVFMRASDWSAIDGSESTLTFLTDDADYYQVALDDAVTSGFTPFSDLSGSEWWVWSIDFATLTAGASGTPVWGEITEVQLSLVATSAVDVNVNYMTARYSAGSIGIGGRAPVGADVTCISPVVLDVDVTLTGTLLGSGYSLTDSSGATNAAALLETILTSFFASQAPGQDVSIVDLTNAIRTTPGILDFALSVSPAPVGTPAAIVVALDQYAQLGTLAVS